MRAKEIIDQILLKHPEVTREKILERLEGEKNKTGGLISKLILLRMIAAEFGIEVVKNENHIYKLSIEDLVPGLNDVTVFGRVLAVFPPKAFSGKRSGKFANLFIADKNNLLRVILWNDKVDLIESGEIKTGQTIRFSHGYTREGRSDKVELHISDRSEIEISPAGLDMKDYPKIGRFTTKIRNITSSYQNKRVNVIGTVIDLFSSSTFQRKDSSLGKVIRFILGDKTGEIAVVAWNEKVDELKKKLQKGASVQIVNGKVKAALYQGTEIHINTRTYIQISPPKEEFIEIAYLKRGLQHANVKGEVITQPLFKNVKTSRGEIIKVACFELKDETGTIWVSVWRKHADVIKSLKSGDKIVILDCYVRKGFGDQPELSTRNATTIHSSSLSKTRNSIQT